MPRTRTPPPKPPKQPHDRLFRWTFSQQRHAIGLLRAALPRGFCAQADFGTLRLENADWVSRALRRRQGDLVFSVQVRGEKVYVYVLVEHQSTVDPLMVVRMGIYVWRLYERMLRDDPKRTKMPAIVPLLVHHSKTGWTAQTSFQNVVAWDESMKDELWRYVQSFDMRVVDLHEASPTNLDPTELTAYAKVVLAALGAAGDQARLRLALGELRAELVELLHGEGDRDAFDALVVYLVEAYKGLTDEQAVEMVESAAGPEGKEVIVTWTERVEARGRAKGLLEQLEKRFGPVPAEVRAKVQAADEATLSRWTLRVLDASSLAQVLADRRKPAAARKPAASAAAPRR
jgi:predicted transposase/invertase (TIGR01784 family)